MVVVVGGGGGDIYNYKEEREGTRHARSCAPGRG